MFRLQDNVPDIYINQSRDFQLLCRLYDCINDGVKFDIDSMIQVLSTKECPDKLLSLLQTKIGFLPEASFNDNDIRYILTAFPEAVKHKGTRKGIEYAINAFFKARKLDTQVSVAIMNKKILTDDDRLGSYAGIVDAADLTWTYSSPNNFFYSSIITDARIPATIAARGQIKCSTYRTSSVLNPLSALNDNSILCYDSPGYRAAIRDDALTTVTDLLDKFDEESTKIYYPLTDASLLNIINYARKDSDNNIIIPYYHIDIQIKSTKAFDTLLLEEFLKYIIPTGYTYTISFYQELPYNTAVGNVNHNVYSLYTADETNALTRNSTGSNAYIDRVQGAVGFTNIYDGENL